MLIYTPQITDRIAYIIDVIFNGHLRISYRLTESIDEFQQATNKIAYAPQPVHAENSIYIWQHPLLLETGVKQQNIEPGLFEDEPVFFQPPHSQSFLPFDIFALAFFLLTRYEEYLPHRKDAYGRFPAAESIACKSGFLQKPLVDMLVLKFARKLQAVFPDLNYELPAPAYIATYDIDNAFAYRNKGFVRTAGGLFKQLLRFDFKEVKNRITVLKGDKPDPFDTYQYMETLRQKYNLKSYYFILFSGKTKYDTGLNHKNKKFQETIHQLQTRGKIGCHPSYASSFSQEKLKREINGLADVIGEKIRYSRSHYLLLNFPDTYQKYISNGIEMDFTLCYPELPGFRASTCKCFHFFDLSTNKQTSLKLMPLIYMEATFLNYMKLSPEQAFVWIKDLIDRVKSVNGTFVSLWHNENFEKNGADWKKLYERSLAYFQNS
jgi:hypothetical protein